MEYLIDSNSLIDSYLKWYQPEVFGSVWDFIASEDSILMTGLVYNEIKYPDELKNWTIDVFENEQIGLTQDIVSEYSEVMDWITDSTRWNEAGISEWQNPDKADPWLIATAKINNQTIVTLDGGGNVSLPNINSLSKKEPKISAVAAHFGVRTITMYELLLELKLRL